jgi:hypothetical protein
MTTDPFKRWTAATAELPWGVQHVMYQTLEAVKDEQIKLAYSMNYNGPTPCLVNAVANMTQAGGGHGVPYANFEELVRAFDNVNRALEASGINNGDGLVSPLAAEVLLRAFATLKTKPIAKAVDEALQPVAFEHSVIRERTDEELTRDWLNALNPTIDCEVPDGSPSQIKT